MPTQKKLPLLLFALALAVLLAFPLSANATLAFGRNPFHPEIFIANDDGSRAGGTFAKGEDPRVSPDGNSIAYLWMDAENGVNLKVANVAGGPARTLMSGFREPLDLEWSPDSTQILALRGPEVGRRNLVLIDVATGTQHVLANGAFSGFSFSPDGTEIVYSRARDQSIPPHPDIFRLEIPIPGKVFVQAPQPQRLTSDHRSSYPLWGPTGQIVFVKTLGAKKRKYGPKNELYLMNSQGRGVKRLTHTKVPPLLQGLFPTDWSANGSRLLAEFEGQDTTYAVRVNPKTGAQKPVAQAAEQGFVGTALSSDGRFVLGYTGGFDPGLKHDVVSIPYAGGKPKILAKNAFEPDWSF